MYRLTDSMGRPGNQESDARSISSYHVPLITEEIPDLPGLDAIYASQANFSPQDSSTYRLSKCDNFDIWKNSAGKINIPDEDQEL